MGWMDENLEVLRNLKEVIDRLNSLQHKLSGPKLDMIMGVIEKAENAHRASDEVRRRYCQAPVEKLIMGETLTREEYYLLRAMEVVKCFLGELDEYETSCMFHYQDQEWSGLIDLDEYRPKAAKLRIHGLRHPEQLRLQALRPEQKEFFEEHCPEILSRFQK
jgi:hypothetical protein